MQNKYYFVGRFRLPLLGNILSLFIIGMAPAAAQETITIPMTAEAWDVKGYVTEFAPHRGEQALKLDDQGQGATGSNMVTVRDVEFQNGTIEYDVALDEGARFSSLYFRMLDSDNTEHVYLRAFFAGDENASGGFQYAAVVDGVNYWDLSFPYQTGVTMYGDGEWNHVKIVVRDRQLLAYVNDMERPALYIPVMDGKPGPGSIGVDGKAWVASLEITPDATPGLASGEGFDPTYNDVRYLRDWEVSQPVDFPRGREVIEDDLPGEDTDWMDIRAERHGLVNLSRRFGKTADGERRLVWLKMTLDAREATDRYLDLGISDEVYIYLNGQPLYIGRNPYFTPAMLSPNGRATPENARIKLPLQEGENELLIGVTNYFFGWGIVARLDDGAGLKY